MAHLDVTANGPPVPVQANRSVEGLLTVVARTAPSGAIVVVVRGEVDTTTRSLLHDGVVEHLRSTRHLVLDLGGVDLLCAAGLSVLVEVQERALLTDTHLCLVAHSRQVRLPLQITGLVDVFDLHLDVGEALACRFERALADPRKPGDLR